MNDGIKIPISADVSDLDRAMDRAEGAMADAARAADRSADKIESSFDGAAGGFTKVTEHADSTAANLSILAGAVGDVSSGVTEFGGKLGISQGALDQFSAVTDGLSTAMMFGAGIADITAVATDLYAASTKVAAVGSKVMAAGQWALNAAMSANPIGLVVIAVAALVGGFVLAYKKSETFRNVVNKAFNAVKSVVMPTINWIRTAVPEGFERVVSAVTGLPGRITAFGGKFLNAGKTLMGKIFEGFKKVGSIGVDIGRNLFNGVVGGINTAIDKVNDFLPDKISLPGPVPDIDLPDNPVPHIPLLDNGGIVRGPGVVRVGNIEEAMIPLSGPGRPGGLGGNTYVLEVSVAPGTSPAEVGRQLVQYIDEYERAGGRRRAS